MGYSSGRKSSSLKTPPSNGDYSTQKEKGQNVNRSDKMGKENTPKHDALELRRQRNLRLLVRRRRRESSVHYFHLELPRCQAPVRPSGVVSPVEKIKSWVTTKKRWISLYFNNSSRQSCHSSSTSKIAEKEVVCWWAKSWDQRRSKAMLQMMILFRYFLSVEV